MGYIIGTGWWCDSTCQHAGSRSNNSDDIIRQKEIFDLWYYLIDKYTNPEKIIVTDSNSPIIPNKLFSGAYMGLTPKIELVRLLKNFKPAIITEGKYCGWTRAFLNGAFYAYLNDMDYVYIEQDCLIHNNVIEKAFEHMDKLEPNTPNEIRADYSHGMWNHQYKVEQSFVIIKHNAILRFIGKYTSFEETDKEMRPELKFLKIGDKFDSSCNLWFRELPFGYGRKRPVNFNDDYFYIQHCTRDELAKFLKLEEKSIGDFFITEPKKKY